MEGKIRLCLSKIYECRVILLPVLSCIWLTQLAWVNIYNCVPKRNLLLYDGDSLADGLANAALVMSLIVSVSVCMLLIALRNYKRLIQLWLSMSCMAASFVISGVVVYDGLVMFEETTRLALTTAFVAVYGTGACIVHFTNWLPHYCHQSYIVTNCAGISVFYLTNFPGQTIWFLVSAIVIWDLFAVLSPFGPLKMAIEMSQDYNEDVLRFLLFTAHDENSKEEDVKESVEEEREYLMSLPTADSISSVDGEESDDDREYEEEREVEEEEESSEEEREGEVVKEEEDCVVDERTKKGTVRSARDALEDGVHLGLGDFVFYSMLVGKSTASGLLASSTTTVAVLIGLVLTLNFKTDTLPALPVSIALGMATHFSTVFLVEPFIQNCLELFHSL